MSLVIAVILIAYLFNVKVSCMLNNITYTEDKRLRKCIYSKWGILSGCVYMCILVVGLFFTEIPASYFQIADLMISLIIIAIVDIKLHIIPDLITASMTVTQILCGFLLVGNGISYINIIIAAVLAIVLLLISKISKEQVGMGDVKLLAAVGLIYGLAFTIYSMIFSLLVMIIFSIPLLIMKKVSLKTQMPFTPFFIIGTLVYIVINMI